MAIVGIDLGTTNSLVAAWTPEGARLIPNALGEALTPSVVNVTDGEVTVGRSAGEQLITRPDDTIAAFKRWMGTEKVVRLDQRPFRAEELSSLVLASLKRDAEAHLGEPIEEAVVSVPAYFNDLQRRATMNAAKLAGIKVERLVNEPTAAALAYGLGEAEEAKFLVFDLGGGTFDVSILDKYDDVMEVRATAGDNYLGGNDFRDQLAAELCRRHDIDRDRLTAGDRSRLLRFAEGLKIELSSRHEAGYAVDIGDKTIEGLFQRADYETLVKPLLTRLRLPLERAISDARLNPDDLAQVVLVGGATRMPAVRSLVARLFGRLPLTHLNPDHLVALGAAAQAGLKTRDQALKDVVMTDVCPYTLGISAYHSGDGRKSGELVTVPIIERNSVVPISRSERFVTVSDAQSKIDVEIYQGENLKPDNNVHLGTVSVAVPESKAGREAIDVRFTYDVNGALEVEVNVSSTREVHRRVFRNRADLAEADLESRFAELSRLKIPPRDQAENRLLVARAERIYAELLGDSRERVVEALKAFSLAIEDPHNAHPERSREQFARFLDRFETDVFRDRD